MKKILAIGNSFSQDATALIELMTEKIYVRNLYIGGCSLERHCGNTASDASAYEYQVGGELQDLQNVSVSEALTRESWDFVTVQQVSGFSGLEASYEPYLSELLKYIRKFTSATVLFHRTWAYETGSGHPDFSRYGNDRKQMWESIKKTTDSVCGREKLRIIDTGEMIARLRNHAFFDVERGGISLNRDGFHLSLNYGRAAAAGVWIKFFTGEIPAFFQREDLSEGYRIIREELKNF